MKMDRILLIHSDPKAADELTFALQVSGFQVVTADEHQVFAEINRTEPDVIVIAEALAKMNGDKPCMQIRQICEAPIIILGEYKEGIAGIHFLESGADVYMTQPLNSALLLAWIRSLLRRSKGVGKKEGYEGDC